MRATATSSAKSCSRVHCRTTPGAVALVIETAGMSFPNSDCKTPAAADEVMQWAQGYSGCIGVSPSGDQLASRAVAGLSLRSALRIAVIGRQRSEERRVG